ncbi:MAG: orotidine-5'-phosphate decarboxylase [Flavobacteriaceae bacterium]|nr:orotidine-5'-phosphate decarboxylase [Flavobacteriaceae bacterium]|tara:strand:- start:141 stop:965 length:825 start_codon:yes stop_codon:yes gene_type:complete
MNINDLVKEIKRKKSFLCLGLDSDISKIPSLLLNDPDPVFSFNKMMLDSLNELITAVKINTAFYEENGSKGWVTLEKTINYINLKYPEIFTIADAKRGDIGNTSNKYAKAFFETLSFDSITVSPYMGNDSVEPFLNYKNNHTILLALTSNNGSKDFQFFSNNSNILYKEVVNRSKKWKGAENLMYVVGATKSDYINEIRAIVPNSFLLVPGVGFQGGSLKKTFENGANKQIGLLVNSSRSIIYAGNESDFLEKSYSVAKSYQSEMEDLMNNLND